METGCSFEKLPLFFWYGWRTNWYTWLGSRSCMPRLFFVHTAAYEYNSNTSFHRGSISNDLMKQLGGAHLTLQAFVPFPKCCFRCEGGCFLQQAISLPCSLKQMKKLLDIIWQVRPRYPNSSSSSSIRQQYVRLYVTVRGAWFIANVLSTTYIIVAHQLVSNSMRWPARLGL